jgi:hypothetical protein
LSIFFALASRNHIRHITCMNRKYLSLCIILLVAISTTIMIKSKKVTENNTTVIPSNETNLTVKKIPSVATEEKTAKTTISPSLKTELIDSTSIDNEISKLLEDAKISEPEAAKKLIDIVKNDRVTIEQREEALQHALNLLPDSDFQSLIVENTKKNFFENPDLQRVLLDDAYNREDKEKISILLALQENGDNEIVVEARELLAFLLGVNAVETGEDIRKWTLMADEYLKKQSKK